MAAEEIRREGGGEVLAVAADLGAAAGVPLGRLGEPSELGDLVAFLASERASYITGAVHQVDGGMIGSNV